MIPVNFTAMINIAKKTEELMKENSNNTITGRTSVTYVMLGVILAILVALLIYFFLAIAKSKTQNSITNINNVPSTHIFLSSAVSPKIVFHPQESNANPTIPATCNIEKGNDPFLAEAYSEGTTIHGEFHGFIQTIKTDTQNSPQILTLTSPDKKQTKNFDITQARNEILNLRRLRDIDISNLMIGKEIYIFFDCSAANNNTLTLTRIGIVL